MTIPGRVAAAVIGVFLLGIVGSADADERMKHSGTIVSIAKDRTTFVLAEIGPWRVRGGATVITYRTIEIRRGTRFAIVSRFDDGGTRGDFVELELEPEGVYVDDYVTVDCRHEGTRMLALKVTVTEALPALETGGVTPR
jgi:hypothetical protein